MNCCAEKINLENYKNYDKPVFAGNFRFLLGLVLAFLGFYIGILTDIQGHGLALLMLIGSPFMIFKDGKKS